MMSESNGYAPREALLGRFVRRFKDVTTRLGKFRIRSINEGERARFEASLKDKQGNMPVGKGLDVKCRVIVLGIDDGNGNQLYSNSDIDAIRQQDSGDIDELATPILDFWGMTDGDVEELEKNSEATVRAS